MADLHIAEFSGLASMDQNTDVLAFNEAALTSSQVVLSSSTSTPSAAFNIATRYVKLTAGGPMSIAFGPAATVVATVGGWFLASGESIVVRVSPSNNLNAANTGVAPGTTAVACITDTP